MVVVLVKVEVRVSGFCGMVVGLVFFIYINLRFRWRVTKEKTMRLKKNFNVSANFCECAICLMIKWSRFVVVLFFPFFLRFCFCFCFCFCFLPSKTGHVTYPAIAVSRQIVFCHKLYASFFVCFMMIIVIKWLFFLSTKEWVVEWTKAEGVSKGENGGV